ncbi:uncharacterized protein L3040_001935 [Drepanopeziza brunnea f. sp. 'multigermtubi']|uniref:RNA recognition domain-containing protein n=1 Tax=Marssonina brunnea f. sp. multigermtubi (strain MB_m1) TaxID=1072389 RepID=K1X3Y8_MARBU|nr:RNA recognition domain-containing protein [Drepanopeziza brunnea f. sp. 'multigermtubi' MB_m1]EKD19717.1 RNA recognition domain-containing protein [Drepanopeziza brunnea f. sp. 'multigermtubi' MB_m1]KAJ5052176.1 hypothetical protein L3040_001935 [Drepanopeziza brunnea f. sp. 'multigermtubi']
MLFPEEDAGHLKTFIVKRLENTSDADADVLADYVLALLRHDGDTETVRTLCEAEIPDFLKEDSAIFVRDIFEAIQYKLYLPGAPPLRRSSIPFAPPNGPSAPSAHGYGNLGMVASFGPQNGSRKRPHNDRGDGGDAQDRGFIMGDPNGRTFKQPRRGGPAMGRGGFDGGFNQNGGRGGYAGGRPPPMNLQGMPPQGFPAMPSPPLGMPPLDPNNPMAAILAMQAMGFPIPGMPSFPQPTSPGSSRQNNQRCRDFDLKGFCARGNQCHFDHGEHKIWVPPASGVDEYDPTNSGLMTGVESASPGLGPMNSFNQFRGGDRGRGRGGFVRGDRTQLGAPGRKNGRSELSSDRPNYDKSNTTIVVENIPEERFSEDEVRGFFSTFGNIEEVSMRPYKRLAIVKYDDWNAANNAYTSPAVIFDNRFVKVYWYNGDDSLPKPHSVKTGTGGFKKEGSHPNAPVPNRATSEPQIDIEEFARKQQEVQKAHEEKKKKKQEMEVAKKELERRQEELMKNQAEEKRKLMERLAAKSVKSGSPANGSANGTPAPEAKTKSETEVLKAQLAALEAEAKSLGLDTSLTDTWGGRGRGRGRGRGGYRGRGDFVPRGRGGYRGRGGAPFSADGRSFNLDNRPKTVSVTGVDFSDSAKDGILREYLFTIGEFTNIDSTSTRAQITFKDRKTAEKFIASISRDGGELPSAGKVELAWVKTPLPPIVREAPKPFVIKAEEDTQMEDGDAMAASSPVVGHGRGNAEGNHDQQENLDYDVADDNDWGVQ